MVLGLPYDTLGFLWLGALIGGIAAGASGFAFGLAASSIWLHRLDPVHSAFMVTACGLLLHSTTIWQQRKHVDAGRVLPFVLGGLAGVPIGVHFLAQTDAGVLKGALGAFLTMFGAYALLAPRLPVIAGGGRSADVGIGFVGGVLGGLGGYSGVLPTIWTQLRGWPKEIARGVYQPFVIVMQAITLAGIIIIAFDWTAVRLFVAVLPPLFVGTWIGWQLYGRLDDRRFRQGLAMLLIASGLTLVL
ncbi:MAG TPA: sulfite exporter TauE/SafE family protein [Xanthobacteraceae bacterium]|nr:sulfite exporter TauE/SafE family protein [Xanthobacteraceae bacterium]